MAVEEGGERATRSPYCKQRLHFYQQLRWLQPRQEGRTDCKLILASCRYDIFKHLFKLLYVIFSLAMRENKFAIHLQTI